jgi:type II secretion system protein C
MLEVLRMNRSLAAILILVLGLVGGGIGLGVNQWVAAVVAPDGDLPESVAVLASGDDGSDEDDGPDSMASSSGLEPSAPMNRRSERTYLDGILCRNIFDPLAIEDCKTRMGVGGDSGAMSDLPVQLVGTMVARPDRYSVAFITEDDEPAGSYGVNDRLLDATILEIEEDRVKVRRGTGREEYLTVGESDRPVSSAAGSRSSNEDGDDEITKVGDNKYVLDRETIDKYLSDMDALSRMGRALLHRGSDGEFDGYRLSAIRRNTLADKLGIRNGDVIHSVNGKPLNSVQAAMEAYQTINNENQFNFEVTRRGERTQLDYEIQ